ncbi:PREDICTED: peptidyl-prolyl cis-trans isomerase [Prunus dulcis]|uniref:PREDICTED: peptidyl-prolyl cis-trans isomerase n=1 Tax=Prunus dulcis TaxID=3755 RepID=A0A5E4F512_PRUDU|nr:PREDICTED: peptidyl-prolyl cis-trans isomerase [Prunus dulcis]
MASIRCLTVNHPHHHHPRLSSSSSSSSKPSKSTSQVADKAEQVVRVSVPISSLISRRCAILITWLPLSLISASSPSEARERRNRKVIPLEDYRTTPDGLKYYDLVEGKGPVAEKGSTVEVHFDCLYRGITAVSSRESKLLAGNRSIAQVLNFTFVGVLRASACSYHAQPLF